SVPEPEPRNFSFNSPHGACPTCTGIGSQLVVDGDLVVPDPSLSLNDGAIAAWSKSQFFYPELLETVSKYFGIDMDKPWKNLNKQQRDVLLNGTGQKKIRFGYKNQYGHSRWYEAPFEGVVANLQRRFEETQSEYLKQELERYMSDKPCPACKGRRLKPESLAVTIADRSIADVCMLSVNGAIDFFTNLGGTEREQIIARGILKEIGERLQFMIDVGLEYLTIGSGACRDDASQPEYADGDLPARRQRDTHPTQAPREQRKDADDHAREDQQPGVHRCRVPPGHLHRSVRC